MRKNIDFEKLKICNQGLQQEFLDKIDYYLENYDAPIHDIADVVSEIINEKSIENIEPLLPGLARLTTDDYYFMTSKAGKKIASLIDIFSEE